MKSVLIIGAGKIGVTISNLLYQTGDYQITLADHSEQQLNQGQFPNDILTLQLDATEEAQLRSALFDKYAVVNAGPYHITHNIAKISSESGVHYLDLTEDIKMARHVETLARNTQSALIPQCGLAPGFVSIVAYDIARKFDQLDVVHMRVGALPRYPSNALNYNLTWSTDGVINEYLQPCEAIVDGQLREVPALEEKEELSIDGEKYEAFNTSGGLGTLCISLQGRVRNLNYRSIRYPGHCNIMKALLNDLRLSEDRETLKNILENALPSTSQDVVIIFVTIRGHKNGRYVQETYANKIFGQSLDGIEYGAIQLTTAGSVCAVLDLLNSGVLSNSGFIRQEDIQLDQFLSNRFGRLYSISHEHAVQ